jgi:hypothetical protein
VVQQISERFLFRQHPGLHPAYQLFAGDEIELEGEDSKQ